jgi:hypothetical protein
MSEARERLRIECLRGRILGIEGPSPDELDDDLDETADTLDTLRLRPPTSVGSGRDSWKHSWRRATGKHSRGRVKGIAEVFERPRPPSEGESASPTRTRTSSTDRTPSTPFAEAEVDPTSEGEGDSEENDEVAIKWSEVEPLVLDNAVIEAEIALEHDRETTGETDASVGTAPSFAIDLAPVESHKDVDSLHLDRDESSSIDSGISTGSDAPFVKEFDGDTVQHVSSLGPPASLSDVFAVADRVSEGLDIASVKSRDGSMIVVRRSQLNECALPPRLLKNS